MDEDLEKMTREQLMIEAQRLRGDPQASLQHETRPLLASSSAVGPVAGEDRSDADRPELARVSARLPGLPSVA